jgi:two-component system LytT family response regulator
MEQKTSETLRVLIVDDEAPARKRLRDLLANDAEIGTVDEAENGMAAVAKIEAGRPDIVFLDVQMPEIDGFGVIEAIGVDRMPLTVFVTAYDQYALKAFEADAVDYLLKPFGDRRFEQAVARAKSRLRGAADRCLGPNVLELVARRETPGALWDWIVIKGGGVTKLVMASELDWIAAAGVYVNLHFQGRHQAAGSAPLRAHSPVERGEHQGHRATRADFTRRIRGAAARRRPSYPEPELPGRS